MLRRNEYCAEAKGDVVLVLHGHLRLGVGTEPCSLAALPRNRQAMRELVRELHRERHQLRRLVRGEAEHESLIARAAGVDTHRDVRRLARDELRDLDAAGVERLVRVHVSDLANRIAHDAFVVHGHRRRDLAGEHDLAALTQNLTGDSTRRVSTEVGVENGVGDVIADFVRVAFADRLGCEDVAAHFRLAAKENGPDSRRGPLLPRLRRDSRNLLEVPARGPSNRGNHRVRREARLARLLLQVQCTRPAIYS